MKTNKLYQQTIEEEKQKLSYDALVSAQQKLKRVRWVQLRWSLLAIFAFIVLIIFTFFQSSPSEWSFINDFLASYVSFIVIFGVLLIAVLLLLLNRQTNKRMSKYIEQGLIEEQDIGYHIKPCHTGRGYLFLRKDRFVYIDDIQNEAHKEIMYEDVRLVIYEELIVPHLYRMPKLPIYEFLICLYTHEEAYVFSTTGLVKMPVQLKSVVESSAGKRGPFMNGRLMVRDIESIGIKTYYSRLGIPFWLRPYILIPVSIFVIILGIGLLVTAFDFLYS